MARRTDGWQDDPSGRSTNLPLQLTTFVGRQAEREEVKRLLADARLLTLTGAGGVGKTRLALEVAQELVGAYQGGVWLVGLAPLSDPGLVSQAVAGALQAREVADEPLLATLARTIGARPLLLVLDNCEHLVAACADLADRLLRKCPGLQVVATSREPLGVPGERVWPVPALALPDPRTSVRIDQIAVAEAVGLFVERARSTLAQFALDDGNATAVAEICRRLDGLPLAIELAAACITALSPQQILERLDDRFRLLTGGSRTAHSRQQTLRAALDWSYQLLAEPERVVFRRLTVFAGGWTLEAAEAVCAFGARVRSQEPGVEVGLPRPLFPDPLPDSRLLTPDPASKASPTSDEVLERLGRLVDKSLVLADTRGSAARYRLLETVRQYGWEKLVESGEANAAGAGHAAYFAALAKRSEHELRGTAQRAWSDRLEQEHDNLRAALVWCREHDLETGLSLAASLGRFWQVRGYLTEGRRWLGDLLARGADCGLAYAGALHVAGELALRQGDYATAQERLEASLASYRGLGQERGAAASLGRLGRMAALRGDHERARELMEQSLGLFRLTGDRWNAAWTLNNLVLLELTRGNHRRAETLAAESLALTRAIGDKEGTGYSLSNLGQVARLRREYERARALLDEAMALFRELDDKPFIGRTLHHLGAVALVQGDAARARDLLREALRVLRAVESERYLWDCLCLLGMLAVEQGEHATGVRLIGAAAAHARVRAAMHPDEVEQLETQLAAARTALGGRAFGQAWAAGEAMTLEQALACMLDDASAGLPTGARDEGERSRPTRQVLSPRERQVAILIARGLSNREIAEALVVAQRTAETHVTHVLGKLGLRSRSQVAVWAVEHGLLPARTT